jgi:hypothetical protein
MQTISLPRRGRAVFIPKIQRFEVPSESRPDKKHIVQISEKGDAQCSCEDWELNADPRYRCKHVRLVLAQRKAKR